MRSSQTKQRTARRAIPVGALFILMFLMFDLAGVSFAALPLTGRTAERRDELQQVLSVVEHRTTDPKVLEKMQKKLSGLDDRELRLAALLCERISRDDSSAGANIAFSIVTAMIVLR